MENAIPVFRFVRCPKCHKTLTEFSEIPVYKCGGCGTILRAKVRSNSGQNLSSVLAIPSSQDNDHLSNGTTILRQRIPDSDVATAVEQAEIKNLNVSDSIGGNICEEKSLGHEQNEVKNLVVSDLNGDVNEAKTEPLGLEGTSIRKRLEEGNEELQKSPNVKSEVYDSQKSSDKLEESSEPMGHSERFEEGNEELEKSPNVKSEVYDSQKSSDKLEESSEPMGHCSTSDEDMMNMEFGDDTHFRTTTRSSSQAYEGSVSSTDGDRKNHNFRLSRRTFRNKNMSNSTNITDAEEKSIRRFSEDRLQDPFFTSQAVRQKWTESENHSSSSSPSNDVKVKILSRVDELRNELRGFLNETDNSKDSSLFSPKVSQFQGKVPSKEYRSSLIPLSGKPSSSYIHNHSGETCCHNEHCRPCPHNVCCHLSEHGNLPPHLQNTTLNQEPQILQFKVPRPQNIVRLCRPVSGGAPFVMCYKCFKLLQLPTDFLVSPKRVNKLRCGACSQVLMYFFRPRSSSMPPTPIENQHPPSEENDELSVVAVDENSASQHEDITAWDRISTSESTFSDVEPALHKSRSFQEEQGARLHNLMGYSSASEILFHKGYSHDGYQSTETLKI